jgi:hypothetical protein
MIAKFSIGASSVATIVGFSQAGSIAATIADFSTDGSGATGMGILPVPVTTTNE